MSNADSRITIHMAASLDGFIARKDGSVDWMETSDEFEGGEVMAPEEIKEFLRTIDCYVMGSRTYETALRFEERGYGWSYGDKPTYHAAGGYAAGLVLQKAMLNAGSTDPDKVKAALEAMNIFTFYGGIQFDTSAAAHGLQISHEMVVAQWQYNDAGELAREVIWPADVATSSPLYPISMP